MRLRLIPVLIFAAAVTLAIKVGAIWEGVDGIGEFSRATAADTRAPEPPGAVETTGAATPAPNPTEAGKPREEDPGRPEVARLPTDVFSLSDEEIDLLQRLSERRAEIEQQVQVLEQRSALLQAAEQRIDEKISELNTLRETIEALLVRHDEQEEAQMQSLVKIYESMKPKDAARIFEGLDMVVLLDVIERMKERKTAPILAQMNPERAKEITLELAQRRDLPKRAGASKVN
ncbi:MAG: hypothetical protein QNJ67_01280 [Kiloniellales bacterium]|nr:hypothetical protein [Kiloniellales bacterium]